MNRHILMMALSCVIPLGLIFFLPYVGLTSWSGSLWLLIVLVCPLLPLWMLFHGHDDHHAPKHNGGEPR